MSSSNEAARDRYITREILALPPVSSPDGLLPVPALQFKNEAGDLLDHQKPFDPAKDRLPPDTVTLITPANTDYRVQYGKMINGSPPYCLTKALMDRLGFALPSFTMGVVFDETKKSPVNVIMMNKSTYQKMAKDVLKKLSKANEGAEFLGLKNPVIYQNALFNPDSMSTKIVDTLLEHGGLDGADMRYLEAFAKRTENYAFLQHLNDHRGRGNLPLGPNV
jgi:hypothetical protein